MRHHVGFKRYFKNTVWLMGEQVLRISVGVFVGIWIARYLGPVKFGIFSYSIAFAAFFASIAKLGLDTIMVRELVNHPEQHEILLGTAFWLKMLGALLVMVLLAVIVPCTSNDAATKQYIFIIASGLMFQSFEVIIFYFQSQVLAKIISICRIIQLIISFLFKVLLLLLQADLLWFAILIAFDAISLSASLVIAYKLQKKIAFYNYFDFKIAKNLLYDSWPLIIGSFSALVYMQIDKIMIKNIMTPEYVGYYSVAVSLSEVWLFITVTLTNSLFPSVVSAKKKDNLLYINRIQQIYNLLMKIAVVIAFFMYFFSEYIVIILYGESYRPSIFILNIYIWSTIFVFLSNGSWLYYINENLQRIAAMRLVFGAILNVVLNYYLIRKNGVHGAAYSTLISYAASSYFINLLYKETRLNFVLQTKSIFNILNIKTWINPISEVGNHGYN